MWACESHAPGGGITRGFFGCATGPAMRGGSRSTPMPALAQTDIGVLHDLAPPRHLLIDEAAELLWRGRSGLDVELLEAGNDIRIAQRGVDSGIELLNNRRRRAVRHEDAIPL